MRDDITVLVYVVMSRSPVLYAWRLAISVEGCDERGVIHLHADDAGRPEEFGLGDPVERARQQVQRGHHLSTGGGRVVDREIMRLCAYRCFLICMTVVRSIHLCAPRSTR